MLSENQTIITWRPTVQRPEEESYVLLKCVDETGRIVCEGASYENGRFFYVYDKDSWGEINEKIILGWSYYPFDERK